MPESFRNGKGQRNVKISLSFSVCYDCVDVVALWQILFFGFAVSVRKLPAIDLFSECAKAEREAGVICLFPP